MRKWLGVTVLVVSMAAWSQEKGEGPPRSNKPTTYDFEDDTIEGDLSKPDGEYVEARKKVQHSNLIRIREEFKEKVMQSVSDL